MKSIFRLFLLWSIFSSPVIAQQPLYQFAYSEEPFVPLTNSTSLNLINLFDNYESIQVPLGFAFEFQNEDYNQVWVSGPQAILMTENYDVVDEVKAMIFAYVTENGLANAPGAKVSYRTIGTAPNRIFQIEWLKVGFEGLAGEVSFQIWLYETSNKIQIRLGPQTVPDPVTLFFNDHSPLIGLGIDNDLNDPNDQYLIGYAHWVQGLAAAPTGIALFNYDATDEPQFGTSTLPSSNAVFTFLPAGLVSASSPAGAAALQVFPNPARSTVYFSEPAAARASLVLTDALGRVVCRETLESGAAAFELPAGLAPGAYYLCRQVDGKQETASLQVMR
jgi:hypothetical protein